MFMNRFEKGLQAAGCAILLMSLATAALAADVVRTTEGKVRGEIHKKTGVTVFFGMPFAKRPVGDLRWKAPQLPAAWSGVRAATSFGPRCMQDTQSTDVVSRAPSISEDCLYLNVWTPSDAAGKKLPVLAYIYGGGFQFGDGSESRYGGEAMAQKGIVVVTLNYRLGVFGFLALPELTQESPNHASGDYGLLDQVAALQWVQRNIAAFGGDPQRVTIAGESAGSMSVSAQMASPVAKGLFSGAIGESGSAIVGTFSLPSLAEAEHTGIEFMHTAGAQSLAGLRAMPASQVREISARPVAASPSARRSDRPAGLRFMPVVDGYVFPKPPLEIYVGGEENRVPLMAGSNSEEGGYNNILGPNDATVANYKNALQSRFHDHADDALRCLSCIRRRRTGEGRGSILCQRSVHRLQHLEVDRSGYEDGRPAHLLLLLPASPSRGASGVGSQIQGLVDLHVGRKSLSPRSPSRCRPLGGDRVCDGHSGRE